MAFTAISVVAFNNRARLWKCTGDGAATSLTVPTDGTYTRASGFTGTAVSFALDTPTIFTEYPSARGGLNSPLGGTAQAVTSTTVNSDGTYTVVFTVAPTNAHVIWGVTVADQSSPDI